VPVTSPSGSGRTALRGIGPLIAILAVVVTALCLVPAAAHAAEGNLCADGGVNVVVDFQELGGGIHQACVESGADKVAAEVFEEAGFELTPVGAFPGAACQVDGQPADASCANMPPADAYWGLYLAAQGKWGYAPKGADELTLADGAFVAFSWQGSTTPAPPGVAPVTPAPEASNPPADSSPAAVADDEKDNSSGAVPWWVPVLVVLLLVVAGATFTLRRRTART
jgi:hypothetical protein